MPQAWGVLESQAGNYQLARRLFRCAVKAYPQSEPSWKVWLMMSSAGVGLTLPACPAILTSHTLST